MEKKKGFILSGISSGIGKTTISIALMNILKNYKPYNFKLSAFKSGPDFIDPTFHKFITENPSYNLDLFLMEERGVKHSFYKHCKDFSIIEGAMGLYDGIDNSLDNFSVAHLSRVLQIPVILVIDGEKKGTSIAAQILGYKNFDTRVNIIGVIINKVNSEKTYLLFKEAIEKYTGIKCLGYLIKNTEFDIESRHLGLLQAEEISELKEKIDFISNELIKTTDIDYIVQNSNFNFVNYENIFKKIKNKYKGLKIAVAKDKAFSFYYQDNLELLEYMGAEIEYFSPLYDKEIPKVDFLYFGGGYPENYLKELRENKSMINSIQIFQKENGTILGECGGFMYLSKGVRTLNGEFIELCNIIDCDIKMGKRLDMSRFGYVDVEYFGLKGKAHEFHYSTVEKESNLDKKYDLRKKDNRNWKCGYLNKKALGGYPHFHFYGSLEIIENILKGVDKN